MMEESEMCTVPGGLAKVKKQFEDEITSSRNTFAQYQYQHQNRSEQVILLQVMGKSGMVEMLSFWCQCRNLLSLVIYFHCSLTNTVTLKCFRKSSLRHIYVFTYLKHFCQILEIMLEYSTSHLLMFQT